MTCAWIDTSSAETGSSQTIELRLDRERAGDADALALAAGEFVRIARAHARARRPTSSSSSATRWRRARAAGTMPCSISGSASICADRHARIERRERVLEDDLHACAAAPRSLPRSSASRSSPSKRTRAGGRLDQAQTSRPTVDLPQPDSPTSARVSPGSTAEATRRRPPARSPSGAAEERSAATGSASPGPRPRAAGTPSQLRRRAARSAVSQRAPAPREAPRACARQQRASASRGHERRAAAARAIADAERAARAAKRQPRGGSLRAVMSGTVPSIAARRVRALRRGAGASRAGRPCRDAAGARTASSTGARSTIWPAYITATSSADLGDHAEIVRDQDDRGAGLARAARASGRGSAPGS